MARKTISGTCQRGPTARRTPCEFKLTAVSTTVCLVARKDQLTTTEYAVLGLLSDGERSGYDLARVAARTIEYMGVPSRSQIYRVLPRLVRWGLAESREIEQQGRPDKALYRVTDRGMDLLRAWVERVEDDPAGGVNVYFLKLLFAAVAPPEAAQGQLEAYRQVVERRLGELEEMERNRASDATVYDQIALRHGIIRTRATLAWADEAEAALQRAYADPMKNTRGPR
jgi:DNA-binding PadR family transcriptional regulator